MHLHTQPLTLKPHNVTATLLPLQLSGFDLATGGSVAYWPDSLSARLLGYHYYCCMVPILFVFGFVYSVCITSSHLLSILHLLLVDTVLRCSEPSSFIFS